MEWREEGSPLFKIFLHYEVIHPLMPQWRCNLFRANPLHVSSNFNRVFLLFLFLQFVHTLTLKISKSFYPIFMVQVPKQRNYLQIVPGNKKYIFFKKTWLFLKFFEKNWISKFFRKLKSKFKNIAPYSCCQVFSECLEPRMTKIEK